MLRCVNLYRCLLLEIHEAGNSGEACKIVVYPIKDLWVYPRSTSCFLHKPHRYPWHSTDIPSSPMLFGGLIELWNDTTQYSLCRWPSFVLHHQLQNEPLSIETIISNCEKDGNKNLWALPVWPRFWYPQLISPHLNVSRTMRPSGPVNYCLM